MIRVVNEGATKGLKFNNCGDVNFADYGVLVAKDGSGYYVITCNYDYESNKWYITEDYVDIDDSWIDQDAIESYADIKKEENPYLFASDVISYYGTQNPYDARFVDSKEAEEFLNSLDVVDDVHWDADFI